MKGKIIKGIGGFYYVKTTDGLIECKARGKFRHRDMKPLVGDDVENPTVDAQPVQNTAVENKVEEKVETEKKVETTNAKLPATMYVNVDAVNIRKSADATSEKVTSVGLNCPVTVTAKEADWYKVEVSDGKGYIKAEFLSSNKK